MNEQHDLKNILAVLRTVDSGKEASPGAEAKLVAAFRKKHRSNTFWVPISIAAGVALLAGVGLLRMPEEQIAINTPSPPRQVLPPARTGPLQLKPQAVIAERQKPRRRRAIAAKKAVEPQIARKPDSFISLPYSPPLTQYDQGQVIRVSVPRYAVRSWGIPVNESRMLERVQADVLMGGDGVARAVRIVNNSR